MENTKMNNKICRVILEDEETKLYLIFDIAFYFEILFCNSDITITTTRLQMALLVFLKVALKKVWA